MRLLAPVTLTLALVLAACGNDPSEPETIRVRAGDPVERVEFPRYGVEVSVPKTAEIQRRPRPGVFRVYLGQPFVSMFGYRRKEQIPRKPRELRAARRRLVKQVEKRDPDFDLKSTRITKVAGARAIEIVGDQVISRARLRTRSIHVYKGKAEYVVELLAPLAQYERTDRTVFRPLVRSLKLSGKVKEPETKRDKKGKKKKRERG